MRSNKGMRSRLVTSTNCFIQSIFLENNKNHPKRKQYECAKSQKSEIFNGKKVELLNCFREVRSRTVLKGVEIGWADYNGPKSASDE